MTPEGKVTAAIVRRLKAMRAAGMAIEWLKLHGSPMQRAGWPDLLVIYAGRTLYVEIKGPSGRLSPLQVERLKRLKEAGATVAVVRSEAEFCAALSGAALCLTVSEEG